jgi:outer membrane lipoprotein carrier protein
MCIGRWSDITWNTMNHTFSFSLASFLSRGTRVTLAGLMALASIAASAQVTTVSGLESLEAFVKNTRSGRAEFTQVVTSPARDGQTAKTKTSSGTF